MCEMVGASISNEESRYNNLDTNKIFSIYFKLSETIKIFEQLNNSYEKDKINGVIKNIEIIEFNSKKLTDNKLEDTYNKLKILIYKFKKNSNNKNFMLFKKIFYKWIDSYRKIIKHYKNMNLRFDCTIGLLESGSPNTLASACSYVSNYENVNFYYFTPGGLNIDFNFIKGYVYDEAKWKEKILPYPDVIYDRLRLRGLNKHKKIDDMYEELSHIPFTNERKGDSETKDKIYSVIKNNNKYRDHLIPFKIAKTMDDVHEFIMKYNKVILKPILGSFGKNVMLIQNNDEKNFILHKEKKGIINKSKFEKIFNDQMKNKFIVQKYIDSRTRNNDPFDVRVVVMKNRYGKWQIAKIHVRIGERASIVSNGFSIMNWKRFFEYNFKEYDFDIYNEDLKRIAVEFANYFEGFFEKRFNEMNLDIGISQNMIPYIFEVNMNKPYARQSDHLDLDMAKCAIPYCKYLANNFN